MQQEGILVPDFLVIPADTFDTFLSQNATVSVEELNAAIGHALAAHGGDELSLARAIASQIKAAVEQLASAWDRFP